MAAGLFDDLVAQYGGQQPPAAATPPSGMFDDLIAQAQGGAVRPLTITPGGPPITGTMTLPDTPAAPPSTGMDALKSIGSGLERGAVSAVTGPIELTRDAARWGVHSADKWGRQLLGLPSLTDAQTAQRDADEQAIDAMSPIPNPADLAGKIDAATAGATYQPQTPLGQSAANIAAFVPQALTAPGSLPTRIAAYGLLPGAVSEGAGRLTAGASPGMQEGARIAGGVLGSLGGHVIAPRPPASAILSRATRGVTDEDIAAATQLQRSAQAQGIPITPAEAVQHVTNNASGLGDIQRNLESMPDTAPIMGAYFRQRPGQVQAAAGQLFDRIAPATQEPSAVTIAAQDEAQGALGQIRQDRTAAAGQYYAGSVGDQVPNDRMADVAARLDALRANNPNNPELTAPLSDLRRAIVATPASPGQPATPGQRVPVTDPRTGAIVRYDQTPGTPAVPPQPETYITDVGQLDKIYGALRDQYTGPPPLGQTGTQARAGRIAAQGLGYLDQELRAASPDLAAGRTAYGIMSDRWVRPREIGPIGKIGESDDLAAMGQALYPTNPLPGSHAETAEAVERLPSTAGAITRSHLEGAFNEANQRLQGGLNQWGGAGFAAKTFGNPQQADNIYAGLGALPNGDAISDRARVLAEALRATGTRQPPGSKTAFNTQFQQSLQSGHPVASAVSLGLSPEKALAFVREAYQKARIGSNAESLARVLTDPEGMARLAEARQAVPAEHYARILAAALAQRALSTVPPALGAQTTFGPRAGAGMR